MNKEVKKIRDNIGILTSPKRLDTKKMMEVARQLIEKMSEYYEAVKNTDLNKQIDSIMENIYTILETFANMGIYPDYFFQHFVIYKLQNIGPDGKMHYTFNGQKRASIGNRAFFEKVRSGLETINDQNHYDEENSIEREYNNIESLFKKLDMNYSDVEMSLPISIAHNYFFRQINEIYNYSDGSDIIDDICNLISMLYADICVLVEMGVNPQKHLDNLIDDKINESKKTR